MSSTIRMSLVAMVVGVLPSSILACASTQPRQQPVVGLTKPVDPPTLPQPGPAPGKVEVEDGPYAMWVTRGVRICSGADPFFAFDVSKPTANDNPTMRTLVTCMQTGPLQGRTIRLIGHTDVRGPADYNEKLGLKRAEKVKEFLVTNGVDPSRILTASTGKLMASHEPKDWATDRRVEIELVPQAP